MVTKTNITIDAISFGYWLGVYCSNRGIIKNPKNGKYELMWYLNDDAASFYDGEFDKKLRLYTTKEIYNLYKTLTKL